VEKLHCISALHSRGSISTITRRKAIPMKSNVLVVLRNPTKIITPILIKIIATELINYLF
jgi:hypothetical protein